MHSRARAGGVQLGGHRRGDTVAPPFDATAFVDSICHGDGLAIAVIYPRPSQSAALSAIMIVGAFVFPLMSDG